MTTRLVILGGTDWSDGQVLYAADLNSTLQNLDGALGEVKMFALSMANAVTKATLQTRNWAICDGTNPAAQGISSPTITTTPDLQDKFIRMSDDESSGTTGGASTDTHNHQWATGVSANPPNELQTRSSGAGAYTFDVNGNYMDMPSNGSGLNDQVYTNNTVVDTIPPFYELVFFIKVKI